MNDDLKAESKESDTAVLDARQFHAFDVAVILQISGQSIFIETVEQARDCLREHFSDQGGPSFVRAVAACENCLLGSGSLTAARATFVVAAMEAGYAFEVIEDQVAAFEKKVELEAENGLRTLFSDQSDIDNR